MNLSLPSVSDITALLAALESHPLGATFLLLLMLAGILGIWVYRQGTPSKHTRGPSKRII